MCSQRNTAGFIIISGWLLDMIPSIVFNELTFDFTSVDQWAPSVSSSSITATVISVGDWIMAERL